MKVSELIEQLQREQKKHGDVEVLATGDHSLQWCETEEVWCDAKNRSEPVIVIDVGDPV